MFVMVVMYIQLWENIGLVYGKGLLGCVTLCCIQCYQNLLVVDWRVLWSVVVVVQEGIRQLRRGLFNLSWVFGDFEESSVVQEQFRQVQCVICCLVEKCQVCQEGSWVTQCFGWWSVKIIWQFYGVVWYFMKRYFVVLVCIGCFMKSLWCLQGLYLYESWIGQGILNYSILLWLYCSYIGL